MSDKTRADFEAWWKKHPLAQANMGGCQIVIASMKEVAFHAWIASRRAALEEAAKVADKMAKRDFNWASESADTYHAQSDWAQVCASAIRNLGSKGGLG